ncbi:hypothetical protein GGR73_003295 [Xanthomonas sp. F14]
MAKPQRQSNHGLGSGFYLRGCLHVVSAHGCSGSGACPLTIHSSRRRFAARLNSGVRPAMREIYNLMVFSLGIALCACASAAPPPRCSFGLAPTATVAPRLPPRLHNEFSGKAQVAFVIGPTGHVQSPVIVSAERHPIGRSRGQPVGYNDAILSAVAQWRYPSREQACRHQVPVEFHFEGSSPAVGRSNNSFKPNPLRGSA